jgi:hypothetical protein
MVAACHYLRFARWLILLPRSQVTITKCNMMWLGINLACQAVFFGGFFRYLEWQGALFGHIK